MSIDQIATPDLAIKGLMDVRRDPTTGKSRFGGFTGVTVFTENDRLYVTETSMFTSPSRHGRARYDFGPASEVTFAIQRLRLLRVVTLVGNGNTSPIRLNLGSLEALQSALAVHRSEARTKGEALQSVQAVERFTDRLTAGALADQQIETLETVLLDDVRPADDLVGAAAVPSAA